MVAPLSFRDADQRVRPEVAGPMAGSVRGPGIHIR